ncbi:LuxR C-terminal-related transcriptional regulator [Embleya sp. NBC_00896]|uniref:helix-turn-helix domain-containing protein n=1 Tax=Embleya sp. NBC_00896 TaxID=2975961 RepID=UPI00386F7B51
MTDEPNSEPEHIPALIADDDIAERDRATFAPAAADRLGTALDPARPARRAPHPDRLTDREVEVLRLITDGLNNAGIAAALSIGEATVKTHINNAFAKINARNRADAVRYAHRQGLSQP